MNAHEGTGCSALIEAVREECVQCMNALLAAGANVSAGDEINRTLLIKATATQWIDCMTMLIEAGADLNSVDGKGYTALSSVVCTGTGIKLLLRCGAHVNNAYTWHIRCHQTWRAELYGEVCKLLVAAGQKLPPHHDPWEKKEMLNLQTIC